MNNIKKLYHLWFKKPLAGLIYFDNYADTINAINKGVSPLHTTQVATISMRLLNKGYRIFVHPAYGAVFEIKGGTHCPCAGKTKMTPKKNLQTMLLYKYRGFVVEPIFEDYPPEKVNTITGEWYVNDEDSN